ncbi:MAG: FHA domain-containing protein [Acetatifactor sp.]
MRREIKGKGVKQTLDSLIILCGIGLILLFIKEIRTWRFTPALFLVTAAGMAVAVFDLFILSSRKNAEEAMPESKRTQEVQRLILLDEAGKPIKSWDLQGKVSWIIGKVGQDQELDIDLTDCEYSSFIDFQHAALNYCLDQWYVEDLGSQNGVKIRKVEDGECYRVIHRPCKVIAGDILYIANTKLLLT